MRFGIHTLDDVEVGGKTILLRVDVNQPFDRNTGKMRDITRIQACLPTIRELSDKEARVVLLAHQGSGSEYLHFHSTQPHAELLSELLGREVRFLDDICGPAARDAIRSLKNGDVLMLDNVRFLSEELPVFGDKLNLPEGWQVGAQIVRKLAPLADLYVCDAFAAAHRAQPSLCGFEQALPSAMGRLFEEEFCAISELMETPERLCVFVLGGSKVADSFRMMDHVLTNRIADIVLSGGLVGQILLWANDDNIGDPAREYIKRAGYEHLVADAVDLVNRHGSRIVLPTDCGYIRGGRRRESLIHALPEGELVVDIGYGTAECYRGMILRAKTVFINGPMGIYEQSESSLGTKIVWEALGETKAHTVLGGLDSIAAARKYKVEDRIGYICTSGSSLIRFMTGEELPVVGALRRACRDK